MLQTRNIFFLYKNLFTANLYGLVNMGNSFVVLFISVVMLFIG